MYAPLAIANTIISLKPGQSPMWLNKMVYLVHGWSLAYDRSVVGELPQVWRYGPIYASVYTALSHFRHAGVHTPQPISAGSSVPIVPETDLQTLDLIRSVVERYGDLTDLALSTLAHAEGTPWKLEAAAHNFRVPMNHPVPEWRLRDHFTGLLARHQDRMAA